jgi:hypothetical protein
MPRNDNFTIEIVFDDDVIYWKIKDSKGFKVDKGGDPVISDVFHSIQISLDPFIDDYYK